MEQLRRFGWYRLAALAFLARVLVQLPVADRFGAGLGYLLFVTVVHVALAIGYFRRSSFAIGFGVYAAVLGLIYPFGVAALRDPPEWFIANTVFGVVHTALAIAAWREARAARVAEAPAPRPRT